MHYCITNSVDVNTFSCDTVWEKLIVPALRAGQSLQLVFEESSGVIGESTTSSDMLLNLKNTGGNIQTSTSGGAAMIGAGANNIFKSAKFFTWLTEALLDFTKSSASTSALHPDGDAGSGQLQQKLSSGKKNSDHYQLEQLPQVTLDEVAVYRIRFLAEKEPEVVFDCKDEEEKNLVQHLLDFAPFSPPDNNITTKNSKEKLQNLNLVLTAAKAAANWIKNNKSSVANNRTKKSGGGTSKEK